MGKLMHKGQRTCGVVGGGMLDAVAASQHTECSSRLLEKSPNSLGVCADRQKLSRSSFPKSALWDRPLNA